MNKYATTHTSQVLTFTSNISQNEIMVTRKMAEQMISHIPEENFSDPDTTYFESSSYNGICLKIFAEKLYVGLEKVIPNKLERLNHIFKNQLYGIATSKVAAAMVRKTLYGSRYACAIGNKTSLDKIKTFSIVEFTDEDVGKTFFCGNKAQGNIRFNINSKHDYSKGNICSCCGANKNIYGENEYAYEFIHLANKNIERLKAMKFTVIIGNPPYQLSDTSLSASATPIYNKFIEQAKLLDPKYIIMIIPSRWMVGGKGLDTFRKEMLEDKHILVLHDYLDASECFQGVDIKGGVCYFVRDRDKEDKCTIVTHDKGKTTTSIRYLKEDCDDDIFIRKPELISIKNKVWNDKAQISFSNIVSPRKPYGFCSDFFNPKEEKTIDGKRVKIDVTTQEKYGLEPAKDTGTDEDYKIIGLENTVRCWKYLDKDYKFPKISNLNNYKLFISKAYGSGKYGEKINNLIIAEPKQVCTETFVEIGGLHSKEEANNCNKYMQTKFFTALLGIAKITQNTSAKVYGYIPLQDFTNKSDIDWNKSISEIDEILYKKYGFTKEDIEFINKNVKG